jgi:hypothetical protein
MTVVGDGLTTAGAGRISGLKVSARGRLCADTNMLDPLRADETVGVARTCAMLCAALAPVRR